jgi:hypothetical protein
MLGQLRLSSRCQSCGEWVSSNFISLETGELILLLIEPSGTDGKYHCVAVSHKYRGNVFVGVQSTELKQVWMGSEAKRSEESKLKTKGEGGGSR